MAKKGKKGKKGKRQRRTVGMGVEEFMDQVSDEGGDYLNIKKMEPPRVVGFIHPAYGFEVRKIHRSSIPSKVKTKDGEVKFKLRRFNCAVPVPRKGQRVDRSIKCPICELRKFAAQMIDEGKNPEMKVLKGGKNNVWTLEEIAGNTNDYRRNLGVKEEYATAIVQRTQDRNEEFPVRILSGPKTFGQKLKKVIKSKTEDRGDDGNPLLNPYGFKINYNKDETFSDMWDVTDVDDDVAPLDEATQEILDAGADDFSLPFDEYVRPGHAGDMLNAIKSCWGCKDIAYEEFLEFMGDEDAGDDEDGDEDEYGDEEEIGEEDDEDEEEDEEEEDEEEEDEEEEDEDEEDEDEEDEEEEEEEEPPKKAGKKGKGRERAKKPGKKKSGGKKPGKKAGALKRDKKGRVKCPDCGERVKPSKRDGRCPNCHRQLVGGGDVPF